jgi:hypothetical protein
VTNGIVNADVGTLLLRRTPEASRGRVLARVNAVVRSSSLVALGSAAQPVPQLGPRETFVLAGVLMALAAAIVLVRLRSALAEPAVTGSAATA